jgi:hypothetical protein
MKFTYSLEGDRFEDKSSLLAIVHADDMRYALSEIDSICRNRLKHGENVSGVEFGVLQRIREFCQIDSWDEY